MSIVAEPKLIAAAELDRHGDALLIDVREPQEFERRRLPGSRNIALARLEEAAASLAKNKTVVLISRGSRRSRHAARKLDALGFTDVRVLEGGLRACGLVGHGGRTAWPLERKISAAAGALVLLGAGVACFQPQAGWLLAFAAGAGLLLSAFFLDR